MPSSYLDKKTSLLCVFVLAVLLGCSTMHSSQYSSSPIEVKLTASPLIADIEVDGTIVGEASRVKLLWLFNLGQPNEFADGISYGITQGTFEQLTSSYADLKAAAAYDAIKKSNADVIIAPRYVVTTVNYFFYKTVDVKVIGYKGLIRDIKKEKK